MNNLKRTIETIQDEDRSPFDLLRFFLIYLGFTRRQRIVAEVKAALKGAVENRLVVRTAEVCVERLSTAMNRMLVGLGILTGGTAIAFCLSIVYYLGHNEGVVVAVRLILIASLIPLIGWFVLHWTMVSALLNGVAIVCLIGTESTEAISRCLPEILGGGAKLASESARRLVDEAQRTMKQMASGFFWLAIFYYHLIFLGFYRNPALFLLSFLAAGVFFLYKRAWEPDTIFWRRMALASVIEMTLAMVIYVNLNALEHYGRVFFPSVASWYDGLVMSKKIAATLNPAVEQMLLDRARAARDGMAATEKKISELQGRPRQTVDDRIMLSYLDTLLDWQSKGGMGPMPMPPVPPPPAPPAQPPSCSDGKDNNDDGYADRDDFSCYRRDPNCTREDKGCRCRFGNRNDGETLEKIGKDGKQHVDWYRYNPRLEEKTMIMETPEAKRKALPAQRRARNASEKSDDEMDREAARAALKILQGE